MVRSPQPCYPTTKNEPRFSFTEHSFRKALLWNGIILRQKCVPRLGCYLFRVSSESCRSWSTPIHKIAINATPLDQDHREIGNHESNRVNSSLGIGVDKKTLPRPRRTTSDRHANLGLLSRFLGMLTDSRSFMSYPRHEYFRRTLCDLLGRDVENGEIPNSDELLRPMIQCLCYDNAREFLGLVGRS